MDSQPKDQLDNIMFGYAYSSQQVDNENKILRETINRLQDEISKFMQPALMVCDVVDLHENCAILKTPNGNRFYVNISNECGKIAAGDTVLCEQKNLTVIKKIPTNKRFNVESFVIIEKPEICWENIGGLKEQISNIKEIIELPLKSPKLFKKVGITPPKGILLHGPPGTGKTLLAKAVASSTKSTFIEIVGSELVQKFIGEGAKLVKEIFELAREKAPSIVFIDEIDAIAAKRIDLGTSGEREVQRTFMQLLAELDGFKPLGNVKIIGCTNRMDILDPAVLRPGRLDRLIEVPLPDNEGVEEIFSIHTGSMHLDKRIKMDVILKKLASCSGAEIRAIVTEAGYFAIRDERTKITARDITNAIGKVKNKKEKDMDLLKMFG
ncbi:AAA family ATPase [Candidatus Woesearchaeota archaeon]|nr:AAA family ATPase [Candidatus Woesearchaeota archaeon]